MTTLKVRLLPRTAIDAELLNEPWGVCRNAWGNVLVAAKVRLAIELDDNELDSLEPFVKTVFIELAAHVVPLDSREDLVGLAVIWEQNIPIAYHDTIIEMVCQSGIRGLLGHPIKLWESE